MAANLILYHYWRSSSSWRVRFALDAKAIHYELRDIDLLGGVQHTPEFRALNPAGMIPCIIHQNRVLGESLAILEWLEEAFPAAQKLLPDDIWARAQVRQLCQVIAAGTQPLQNLKVLKYFSTEQPRRDEWARHWIREGLVAFEALLAMHQPAKTAPKYCVGEALTLADICLVPQIYNANRFNARFDDLPRISQIYEHCLTLPAYKSSEPSVHQPK